MTTDIRDFNAALTYEDEVQREKIKNRIPGWSNFSHQAFFKFALGEISQQPARILILGVYFGMDISIMCDIAERYFQEKQFQIIGVDKFDDKPCDDWLPEQRNMTWEQARQCPAPSLERALKCIGGRPKNVEITIFKNLDEEYLKLATGELFDLIYLDAAHDFSSVTRQLRDIKRFCRSKDTIIAGDDYPDDGMAQVSSVVNKSFTTHSVIANRVWFSRRGYLL